MKHLVLFLFIISFVHCSKSFEVHWASDQQPSVLNISPENGKSLTSVTSVQVTFSQSIDPQTISSSTFLVVAPSESDPASMETGDLLDDIDDEKIVSLEGEYDFSPDGMGLSWTPQESFQVNLLYTIILTPRIQSISHYPLSATPGNGNTVIISQFILTGDGEVVEVDEDSSELSSNDQEESAMSIIPSVVINEIYYDDATSDTDGNEFIELYGTPGGDVSGYLIKFINGVDGVKTEEVSLPEGTLIPDDGLLVIADSKTGDSEHSNVPNANVIDNFDPQNGPDSIQLFNAAGELIDVVGYGEGLSNADSYDNNMFETLAASDPDAAMSLSRIGGIDSNDNSLDFTVNTVPSPGTDLVTQEVSEVQESTADLTIESSTEDVSDTIDSQDSSPVQSEASETNPDENASDSSQLSEGEEQSENIVVITEPIQTEGQVTITEVVTDPQRDWNDTAGGNGISFDSQPGTGTVGATDEWFEIHNGTSSAVDLTDWTIHLNDGTDVTLEFDSTSATLLFSDGGSITHFNPDEYLVVGNPEGDMKNTITLDLFDSDSNLIDEVVVDDGNATSILDESYQVDDEDLWSMGEASIGY